MDEGDGGLVNVGVLKDAGPKGVATDEVACRDE